jgi:hypothetical protein
MAALTGVAGDAQADELVERAVIPAMTRPWETLCVSHDVTEKVALAFGGERGGLHVDAATGVRAVLDGELFHDGAILSGSRGAQRIVELYLRDGERFDPGDGWFAAAIWDPREQLMVLVTDFMGHRPLYVARRNGTILIASQLKSLVEAGLEPRLDLQAWAEMLDYENPLGDRTPLEGVRLVEPATTLVIPLDGRERSHERWRYRVEPAETGDERELVEEFGRLLEQAVIRRSEPTTALALSGGLDSRCLAAVLQRQVPDTLSCTYGAVGSEDLELGAQVATQTGLAHCAYPFAAGYIARWAADAVWSAEGQVRCFHAHHVALRQLRRSHGTRSILIGFAGDPVVRDASTPSAGASEEDFALAFHNARTSHTDGGMPEGVLQPEFAAALRGRARDSLSRLLGDEEGDRSERSMQYLFRQTLRRKTLPGAQLFFDDLAPRDPYDDFDLIEFCRRMPTTARRGGSLQRAYISRFGALARLPSPKDGVPPALSGVRRRAAVAGVHARTAVQERVDARLGVAWRPDRRGIGDYATDLRTAGAELLGLLLEPRTLERGQVREDAVRQLVGETLAGRARNTRVLGMLVTLELFQRQFLEGERPQAPT